MGIAGSVRAAAAALALTVGFAAAGSTAALAEAPIDPFVGVWVGKGVEQEGSAQWINYKERDLTIRVQKIDDDSFVLNSTHVRLSAGNEDVIKGQAITFVKAEQGDLWAAQKVCDKLMDAFCAWARFEGEGFTVTTFGFDENGYAVNQTYRRYLAEPGMQLQYSRVVDGKVVRTVEGELVKQPD
ncbi:hypothetical protein [Zavarzinia sp. CC-PAN008]|uniref:hypothetical protein n=1 Tax=Zavarzinia sp. CC-PAN008 TaxID=3243332 RepID=UPI003F74A45D